MHRYVVFAAIVALLSMMTCGCGSTLRGIGKDAGRMGKGVRTFFVSEEK